MSDQSPTKHPPYFAEARAILEWSEKHSADSTFREKLHLYRQLRSGAPVYWNILCVPTRFGVSVKGAYSNTPPSFLPQGAVD